MKRNIDSNFYLNCSVCNIRLNKKIIISHIHDAHNIDINTYEGVDIFLKSSKIEIKYYRDLYIKYILDSRCSISAKLQYDINVFNQYCDMIFEYKSSVDEEDYNNYFINYYSWHKDHPKDHKSREFCSVVYPKDPENFYLKIMKPKNAYTNHGGRLSPWSSKYFKYDGLDEDIKLEKRKISVKYGKRVMTTSIKYWLNKGYTQEEAEKKHYERHATGRKEKFIEKYGEEEGLKRWNLRQERWLKAISSEENQRKIRAGRLKGFLANKNKFYSEISQNLFNRLYDIIHTKCDYLIFYATTPDTRITGRKNNKEYFLKTDISFRFLDFYIPKLKKCIEFDGEYWHKRHYAKYIIRDIEIRRSRPDIKILNISERDFINNPDYVVDKCIDWIFNNE